MLFQVIEYLLYDMSMTPHDAENELLTAQLFAILKSFKQCFFLFFFFYQQPKLNSRALLLSNVGAVVLCYKSSCPYNSLNRQEPL